MPALLISTSILPPSALQAATIFAGCYGRRLAARALYLCLGGSKFVGVQIDQDDRAASCSETFCQHEADPLRSAGYRNDLASNIEQVVLDVGYCERHFFDSSKKVRKRFFSAPFGTERVTHQ
jgi:hypothetical protein